MVYAYAVNWLLILFLCIAPLIALEGSPSSQCLPIVLVAGLNTDNTDMRPLQEHIKKYLPDVYVKNVKIGFGKYTSFWNIYSQTNEFVEAMYSDCNLRNGFNIIAFSQGGLVARYYIERHNMPQVYNLISLATPERGIYGTPGNADPTYAWLNSFDGYISDILYLSMFQRYVSIAGYWNDPLHHEKYLQFCRFLPYLNNEKDHCHSGVFKENLMKLHNMVCIMARCDQIVEPVESTHFGFYAQGSEETIETLFESEGFKNDSLGLKTLFESGRLHLREMNGVHYDTVTSEENFIQNILPFLLTPTIAEVTGG